MSKIAIVYWSGSGNTEAMANAIAEGVQAAGGTADLLGPGDFSADLLDSYQAVAFGCPAMGSEVLEESEFEPMFAALESSLSGRHIALFGSYGWGDGQWMRDWYSRCQDAGAVLAEDEGLICNDAPDADAEDACRALGGKLAAL